MKEQEVKESACDLIHAIALDTQHPYEGIKDTKLLKRLQFIGVYTYKKDLEALGEPELADIIVNKGKTILLENE